MNWVRNWRPKGQVREKESLSHGIFEHYVAGADYDANGVQFHFSDPSFIEQSVQVDNGRYISENDYRRALNRAQRSSCNQRLITEIRVLPTMMETGMRQVHKVVKTKKKIGPEGSETHTIEIKGAQEYFDDVSVVLDDLKDTEQGKRAQAMSSPQFSIRLPAKEVLDGVEYYPASKIWITTLSILIL